MSGTSTITAMQMEKISAIMILKVCLRSELYTMNQVSSSHKEGTAAHYSAAGCSLRERLAEGHGHVDLTLELRKRCFHRGEVLTHLLDH